MGKRRNQKKALPSAEPKSVSRNLRQNPKSIPKEQVPSPIESTTSERYNLRSRKVYDQDSTPQAKPPKKTKSKAGGNKSKVNASKSNGGTFAMPKPLKRNARGSRSHRGSPPPMQHCGSSTLFPARYISPDSSNSSNSGTMPVLSPQCSFRNSVPHGPNSENGTSLKRRTELRSKPPKLIPKLRPPLPDVELLPIRNNEKRPSQFLASQRDHVEEIPHPQLQMRKLQQEKSRPASVSPNGKLNNKRHSQHGQKAEIDAYFEFSNLANNLVSKFFRKWPEPELSVPQRQMFEIIEAVDVWAENKVFNPTHAELLSRALPPKKNENTDEEEIDVET